VYRVSPTLPLQAYSFGNWTAGGGLTWTSQGLYTRRNNLNGYIIQATHLKVTESLFDIKYVKFVSVKQQYVEVYMVEQALSCIFYIIRMAGEIIIEIFEGTDLELPGELFLSLFPQFLKI